MQLAGPWVMGLPADHDGALKVLRAAVELGITHIDTSDAYGPRVTNELIREALHPYPESLHIATKVGATRDDQGGWPVARRPEDLVNLRLGNAEGPQPGSLAEAFETLVELQQQGLIRHLGVSNATAEQVTEARSIAPIVCVQNMYNLAHRDDDELIDKLAADGIAYVPFFPLGGFTPLQSPRPAALAWLLRRSPNILLIPGTSSVTHLRENIAGALDGER
ncbi:aldo/keto reductase [Lentzea kentuckyensis]|uniref:aldo/keto reductase n=1 Tax=Lentzea kentuckyensis TaxID=360086 RepID=UPI000A368136